MIGFIDYTWEVHGLFNYDGVSCYANAVMQCLLNSEIIRRVLFSLDSSHLLKQFINRYINKKNVDTYSIRNFVNKRFTEYR